MSDFTQAQLDRYMLLMAKGAGVTGITFEGTALALASAEDQQKIRAMMKRDVNPPVTHRFAVTSKGT